MLRSSTAQLRLLVATPLALAALLAASSAAAAPMLSFATTSNPQRSPDPNRDTAHYPNGISYTDCVADEVFTFSVVAATGSFQSGTDQLQIWAGTTDCSQYANRVGAGATPGTCQPVSPPVSLSMTSTSLTVHGRDLVYAALGKTSPSAGGGSVTNIPRSDVSVCTQQTTAASIPISLVVVDFNNSDPSGAMATGIAFNPGMGLGVVVDTVGPAAPTQPGIAIGDTLLKLSWTPTSDVTNTAGFTVFCDPPPGKAADAASYALPDGSAPICIDASSGSVDSGTSDATVMRITAGDGGDGGDGGDAAATPDGATPTDASTSVDSGSTTSTCSNSSDAGYCASNVIQPNVSGNVLTSLGNHYYVCANATGASSTEVQINGLTNGVTYTFGVAANDLIGNIGPVTVFPCAEPQPIADFWDKYKGDGGGAGGGFCALEAVGGPGSSPLMGVGVVVMALAFACRRKR
jgi:hypothetical protein